MSEHPRVFRFALLLILTLSFLALISARNQCPPKNTGVLEEIMETIAANAVRIPEDKMSEIYDYGLLHGLKNLGAKLREFDRYANLEVYDGKIKQKNSAGEQSSRKKITATRINNDISYIAISNFFLLSPADTAEIIKKSHQSKTIIIDIRSNLGGYIKDAKKILDIFFPAGKQIIFIKETKQKFKKNPDWVRTSRNTYLDGNLIILVNEWTVSAAEIFADAIQRHKRGIIVGTPTFGKNCIQSIFKIRKRYILKITTFILEFKSGGHKVIPDKITGDEEDALDRALLLAQRQNN